MDDQELERINKRIKELEELLRGEDPDAELTFPVTPSPRDMDTDSNEQKLRKELNDLYDERRKLSQP
jgi:hypothetical protein